MCFFAILANIFRLHTGLTPLLAMDCYSKWSLVSAIFLLDVMVLYYWSITHDPGRGGLKELAHQLHMSLRV